MVPVICVIVLSSVRLQIDITTRKSEMMVCFCVDCEIILSTKKDLCSTCEKKVCHCQIIIGQRKDGTLIRIEETGKINEAKQHRQFDHHVAYVDNSRIKTVKLKKRVNGREIEITREDIKKDLEKNKCPPNFIEMVSKLVQLERKVIK